MITCDKCGQPVRARNDTVTFDYLLQHGRRPTGLERFAYGARHLLPTAHCAGSPSRAQYLTGQPRDSREGYKYNPDKETPYREAYQKLLMTETQIAYTIRRPTTDPTARAAMRQAARLAERLDKALKRGDKWRATAFSTRDEYNHWWKMATERKAKIAALTRERDEARRRGDRWYGHCEELMTGIHQATTEANKLTRLNAILVVERAEALALAERYADANTALKREVADLQTVIALREGTREQPPAADPLGDLIRLVNMVHLS